MSAPAVAPILGADVEETPPPIPSPPVVIDSRTIVDERTWHAAILASAVIVFCLIACFMVMSWMCCVS